MKEFFQSSLTWQILSACLVIIMGILGIVFARKKKELSFAVLQNLPLVSVENTLAEQIEIYYNKVPVREVNLYVIYFANTGNMPILASDFVEDISIEFVGSLNILEVSVANVQPENIKPRFNNHGNIVKLSPLLLNPRDSFTIKVLVSRTSSIKVSGRLIGISKIKDKSKYYFEIRSYGLFDILNAAANYTFTEIFNTLRKIR